MKETTLCTLLGIFVLFWFQNIIGNIIDVWEILPKTISELEHFKEMNIQYIDHHSYKIGKVRVIIGQIKDLVFAIIIALIAYFAQRK